MKVLVTGGTGFTGSHTVRAIHDAGHEVRVLVRDVDKVRDVFEPHGFVPGDVVVGDMTDQSAVDEALQGCDAAIHTAATVDLRRAMANTVEKTNTRGAELVLGSAVRRGLPSIVYVSSLGVFFRPGGPPLSVELPIVSDSNAYARAKAHNEIYARILQEQGAPIRISYPALILGPDDPGMSAGNNSVYSFKDLGVITSSAVQCVDVRDLAALHVKVLEMPTGGSRYVAAAEMLSWNELFSLLDHLTGRRVRRITLPGWLVRLAGSAGDVVKRVYDFDFPMTREATEYGTRWPGADAEPTMRDLDVAFRSVAETMRDTLLWMYRAGHLNAEDVGKLATVAN